MGGFKQGEAIRAKWPGSRLWYKAAILEVNKDGYKVKFEDGTEEDLHTNDVASEARFQVPRRSSSRSPGRRRSRTRSRSPARRTQKKTPSPARAQKKAVASSVSKRVVTKQTEQTPAETSQPKALPRTLLTPTITQTRTEEHHSYTTRSATKSGLQTLEPHTDLSQRSAVPKTKHYEFGGPIGVVLLKFFLPLTVYYLYFTCTKRSCQLVLYPEFSRNWKEYFDLNAALIVFGWIFVQIIIYFIPIGQVVQGLPLRSGKRLRYYENAFYALIFSLLLFGLMVYYKKSFDIVTEKYLALITTCVVLSFVLSLLLYIRAKNVPSSEVAPQGNSGNFFYDFFMGHELNPRIGMFDFKYFYELRPGMIGWVMLDHIFLFSMWKDFPYNPPYALLLLTVFHTLYVADALWYEVSILSTMDILTEGFGFMLAFGDLVWVPFVFTVQARYLTMEPPSMPMYCFGIIVVMNMIGYYIYRTANNEKHNFRRNPYSPAVAHLETITTPLGKKLLVSGWWGFVRKPNYLGDIIMAFSWALLCGFKSCVPYVYPIYLTICLVYREYRDSRYCQQQYGRDWDSYCRRVRYRIIPYIY